jgi:molybdopterin molybdotransferase
MNTTQPQASVDCGCDRRSEALIGIDEALHRIACNALPIEGTEDAAIGQAIGRILAAPVRAGSMVPPFDNAAMDGYAIATSVLSGDGPWTLPVVTRIPAGKAASDISGPTAARIFTGAPIPHGADAVVMQEDVRRSGASITIERRAEPGLNIRRAGSDMAAGELVLDSGRRLGPREIAACAAAGAGVLRIRRRIRVGLLVTGDEVRQAGANRETAQIWDVNTPMLTAAVADPCVDLVSVLHGADVRETLRGQLADLAGRVDLVVTTGGISVGEEDHVEPALRALDADIVFSGVAIKPGKPVSFGRVGSAAWLGLPGNPLSAFVTWQLFGTVLLRKLNGEFLEDSSRRRVVLARDVTRKAGRCELRPATRKGFDAHGREIVTFDDATHSDRVRGLACSDGLMILPAETEFLPAGALVEFLPFRHT